MELGQCLFRVYELAVQVSDFVFENGAFGAMRLVAFRIGLIAPFFGQGDEFALGHFDEICAGWWGQGFGVGDFDPQRLVAEDEPADHTKTCAAHCHKGSKDTDRNLMLEKEFNHRLALSIPQHFTCLEWLRKWGSWRGEPRPTGLGLLQAALALRVRSTAVLSNIVFGVLLVFTGTNVALDSLPEWMATAGRLMPLTHAIEACREVVAGASLSAVAPLLLREGLIGAVFAVLGLAALRWVEAESRRHATLELQ